MTILIAHLSDIHFGGELPAATQAALEAVAALDPTVVAVTGDLTLNGLPREFEAARAWLGQMWQPTIVTPGNHDTPYWNLILRAFTPFDRYRRYIGPPMSNAFDAPQIAIRALNSARGAQPRPNWSKGAIALDQLQALEWPVDDSVRVFACHHPLIDLEGAPVSGGVRRGAQAAAILAAEGVELVLSGHVHVPFAVPLSPGGCYAVGAGTLSQRTRGAPPSFSSITVTESDFEVAVRDWTGARFEIGQEWRLPRRPRVTPEIAPARGIPQPAKAES